MKITDYLSEDLIIVGAKPQDKTGLCEIMVDHLVATQRLPQARRDILIGKLLEREQLASTGIGGSVAIPHASGENIDKMIVAIALAPDGVDFDSIDDNPVKLVFMIVGSERVPRAHLQLLATIVRALKNRELVESVINADSPEQVYELMAQFDEGMAHGA